MKKAAILFLLSFTLTAAACSSKTKEAEGPAAAEEETIYPILVDKSMLTEEPTEIDTGRAGSFLFRQRKDLWDYHRDRGNPLPRPGGEGFFHAGNREYRPDRI